MYTLADAYLENVEVRARSLRHAEETVKMARDSLKESIQTAAELNTHEAIAEAVCRAKKKMTRQRVSQILSEKP